MHTEPAIEPPASPAAAIAPKAAGAITEAPSGAHTAASRGRRHPVRFVLRKAVSALRGDKYMVGAYPPDWPASSTRAAQAPRSEDAATRAAAALSATPSKER
jgi:hypothetical protein